MSTELSGSPGEYHKPAVVGYQNRMDNNPDNQGNNIIIVTRDGQ